MTSTRVEGRTVGKTCILHTSGPLGHQRRHTKRQPQVVGRCSRLFDDRGPLKLNSLVRFSDSGGHLTASAIKVYQFCNYPSYKSDENRISTGLGPRTIIPDS